MDGGRLCGDEAELDGLAGLGHPQLVGKAQSVAMPGEVEADIGPGMEVAAASESLAVPGVGAFARMVDEDDGEPEGAFEFAQVTEEFGDLHAVVLIDAVQAHEGIEDEETWLDASHGLLQSLAIDALVQAEDRLGDDMQVEPVHLEASALAEAFESVTDIGEGVLCEEDEGGPLVGDIESAQAWAGRGDGDGQVEGEPALPGFRLAANDAYGRAGPEVFDQPTQAFFLGADICRAKDA